MTVRWLAGLLALCAIPLSAGQAEAQAWAQSKHGYFFKLSASYFETTEQYNYLGDIEPVFSELPAWSDASFRDVTIDSYLEYGMTDAFTLVMKLPFKVLTTEYTENAGAGIPLRHVTLTNGGLADLTALLRLGILKKSTGLSVTAGFKIPMGYEKEPDNQGPPLGTGYVDAEAAVSLGQSLWPLPAYVSASLGYRQRGGPVHDQILFQGEAGYTFFKTLFLKLSLDGIMSTVDPVDLAGGAIVGDKDELKALGTAAYNFSDRFALVGEIFHIVEGKNTTAGTTYALGLQFTR